MVANGHFLLAGVAFGLCAERHDFVDTVPCVPALRPPVEVNQSLVPIYFDDLGQQEVVGRVGRVHVSARLDEVREVVLVKDLFLLVEGHLVERWRLNWLLGGEHGFVPIGTAGYGQLTSVRDV